VLKVSASGYCQYRARQTGGTGPRQSSPSIGNNHHWGVASAWPQCGGSSRQDTGSEPEEAYSLGGACTNRADSSRVSGYNSRCVRIRDWRAPVSGRQIPVFRSVRGGYRTPVSARHFSNSISAGRRPVRLQTETGIAFAGRGDATGPIAILFDLSY
jgi:hypothetical protein